MQLKVKKIDFKKLAKFKPEKFKWWHITLPAAGIVFILGGIKLAGILIKRRRGELTADLYGKIEWYASKHGVPVALALATIDKESGFEINAYNPECSGGTREYGKRVEYIPYVICKNNKYRRMAILKRRARDKAWFREKWNRAVDRDKPQMWGSFGLMQILPDTAWGYGYKPESANQRLFKVDTNLDIGMKILATKWNKYKNAADVRSLYTSGKTFATRAVADPAWAVRIIETFNKLLSMYESKFNLPKVTRFSSKTMASYNTAKKAIA